MVVPTELNFVCSFSGSIPPELGSLGALTELGLVSNELTGECNVRVKKKKCLGVFS